MFTVCQSNACPSVTGNLMSAWGANNNYTRYARRTKVLSTWKPRLVQRNREPLRSPESWNCESLEHLCLRWDTETPVQQRHKLFQGCVQSHTHKEFEARSPLTILLHFITKVFLYKGRGVQKKHRQETQQKGLWPYGWLEGGRLLSFRTIYNSSYLFLSSFQEKMIKFVRLDQTLNYYFLSSPESPEICSYLQMTSELVSASILFWHDCIEGKRNIYLPHCQSYLLREDRTENILSIQKCQWQWLERATSFSF